MSLKYFAPEVSKALFYVDNEGLHGWSPTRNTEEHLNRYNINFDDVHRSCG